MNAAKLPELTFLSRYKLCHIDPSGREDGFALTMWRHPEGGAVIIPDDRAKMPVLQGFIQIIVEAQK